jgi:hypothetical protein
MKIMKKEMMEMRSSCSYCNIIDDIQIFALIKLHGILLFKNAKITAEAVLSVLRNDII